MCAPEVADVKGIVKFIDKSVFRHQNVGGSTPLPQIFVWGGYGSPTPLPMYLYRRDMHSLTTLRDDFLRKPYRYELKHVTSQTVLLHLRSSTGVYVHSRSIVRPIEIALSMSCS